MNDILYRLSRSKFRSSFHLSLKDKQYISDKGISVIREHAYDFVNKRLRPKNIINDGKQTPFKGHPVFVAQHATGTCCRGCLYKWHRIPKGKELSDDEVTYIVNVIMAWINNSLF